MAKPIEESNAGILPEQELNPLLNPLLAAHMGRWAEVYFTSPPEKRAQAVSDLVRELAGTSTPASVSPQRESEKRIWAKAQTEEFSSSSAPKPLEQPTVICESCGHANSPRQRFCGMCGTPLSSFSEPPPQPFIAEVEQPAAANWDEPEAVTDQTQEDQSRESDQIRKNDSEVAAASARAAEYQPAEVEYRQTVGNPPWPPREQRAAEFSVLSDYESEPVRHPYRIYVGVVVAILLGLLVYKTWESNTPVRTAEIAPSAIPDASPAAKSETPAAAETPAPAPAQPSTKATNTPAAVAPAAPATPIKSGAEAQPEVARTAAPRVSDHRVPAARIANRPVPHATAAPTPASSAPGQSGSEELAAAEKYLNAGSGTARNSQQAVLWLWKSVAKQNLTATLLLSDLYLRGDGVSKSCDQARLLLDAAARKGATAAADRLRNLRAFGCR